MNGLGKSRSQQPEVSQDSKSLGLHNPEFSKSQTQQILPLCNILDLGGSVLILSILQHNRDYRFSLKVYALNLIHKQINFGSHLLPLIWTLSYGLVGNIAWSKKRNDPKIKFETCDK